MSSYEKFLPKSGDNLELDIMKARIAQLEKLVSLLLYVSRETEEFWPYTTKEEQQLAADFCDEVGRR